MKKLLFLYDTIFNKHEWQENGYNNIVGKTYRCLRCGYNADNGIFQGEIIINGVPN